jgi:hypothetical protein
MRVLCLAMCLAVSSCRDSTPPPDITASLTGLWVARSAGPLDSLQIQLAQQGTTNPIIDGDWSAYVAGCVEAPACLREGGLSSAKSSRKGALVVLELSPNSPCALVDATITATMTTDNRMQGMIVPHPCGDVDMRSTSITLTRQ